jgi:CrcB protein
LGIEIADGRNATLAANLIGVAMATFLLVLMERQGSINMRHFLLPGFCAGLTTFSAVAGLTIVPQEDGRLFLIHNVIFSLLIIIIVLPISKRLIPVRA